MAAQSIKALIIEHQTGYKDGDQTVHQQFLGPYFLIPQQNRHYKSTGVKIGAGVDLGNKTSAEIGYMFSEILQPHSLEILQTAARLTGKKADEWVKQNKDKIHLSHKEFMQIFDRHFQNLEKTIHNSFGSEVFFKHFQISGKELLDRMKPQYRMVVYDLFFIGRFSVPVKRQLIPIFAKVYKESATDKEVADLHCKILKLYSGLKDRKQSINRIINHGLEPNKSQSEFINAKKRIQQMISTHSSQQISQMLHNNQGEGLNLFGNHQKLSEIRIDGFLIKDNQIQLHTDSKQDNPFLKDLIVPLKILYDDSIQFKNLSISIDPQDPYQPDGPLYQKVYFPKEMEGTYFAQMMVEADYIMKQLILGVDEKGQPFKYPQSLKKVGIDFESLIPLINVKKERNRQWIVMKKVHFTQKDEKAIRIGDIKMGIEIRVQQVGEDGKLIDTQAEVSMRKKKFCELFDLHYDVIAQEYQCFKIIKRLSKASTIARLIREKGLQINIKLINQLFQKEKTDKSSKIVPRLHNQIWLQPTRVPLLQYQEQVAKVHFTFTGGCDLGYKQQMATFQSLNTEESEEENTYIPFLFQSFIECEEESCQNICNSHQSVSDNKCEDHTSKICNFCWNQLKPGEKFVRTNDDRLFHRQCFHCQACYGYIDGSYSEVQKLFYHQSCSPVVSIGKCYICGSDINRTSKYLSSQKGLLHQHCASSFKCYVCGENASLLVLKLINNNYYHKQCIRCKICRNQIADESILITAEGFIHEACVPKIICQGCSKEIAEAYMILDDKKYHEDCLPKTLCGICKEAISGEMATVGDQSYHDSCLVCFKCKGQLSEIILLNQKFYHPGCLS